MAKFCGNCGTAHDDAAAVCGNCGAPLPGGSNGLSGKINGAGVASIAKTVVKSKAFKIAVPAVAGVAVIAIVLAIILSFTGYKGAIKKFMGAYEDQDIETLISYASVIATQDNKESAVESHRKAMEMHFKHVEEYCGADFKVKYEVKDSRELTKSQLADYKDILDKQLKIDSSGVKEGRSVRIEVKYNGDKREKTNTITLIMLKENGEWKFYMPDYNPYTFADDMLEDYAGDLNEYYGDLTNYYY